MSVIVTFVFFYYLFMPQVDLLENIFPALLAVIVGLLLVFAEVLLMFSLLKDKILERVFELEGVPLTDRSALCRIICTEVFMRLPLEILVAVVSLPLHVIPVVGTLLYCALNGTMLTWDYMSTYFEFKHMTFCNELSFIAHNFWDVVAFGTVGFLLALLPVFNVIMIFTNMVGAALWCVELERSGNLYGNSFQKLGGLEENGKEMTPIRR